MFMQIKFMKFEQIGRLIFCLKKLYFYLFFFFQIAVTLFFFQIDCILLFFSDCMNKVNITFTTSEWNLNTRFSNHAAGSHEFKMIRRDGGYGKFNTRATVKIENYHATGNAFKKGFYTNITFQHDPKGDPEVLMSTCTPVMDSTPALHIVLSNQNVVATIITDTKLTTLTVPYEVFVYI